VTWQKKVVGSSPTVDGQEKGRGRGNSTGSGGGLAQGDLRAKREPVGDVSRALRPSAPHFVELKKDLRELHITHELTVPGTPQQNGDAERLNRVLLERTRAVLAESGLCQNLWAEALVTVNYARNRTPVSVR
jgi:hypothetical protein